MLLQPAGGYVITGLASAARELLVDFYRVNGSRKPEALVVYRAWTWEPPSPSAAAAGGGAAGGQLEAVARAEAVAAEYAAMRKACFDLEEGYCPPITFVLVTRRHNT